MTTKPDLIKWVTDDSSLKITDPGSTKKLAGWLYKEKPAFQFWNWVWNRVSKWLLGLQGGFYDIVIGSAAQVSVNEATHVLADLIDALAVAGSRVLILDGTHTLLGNLSLTNADLKITSESPLAILDVATYTATFSGARNHILLRVLNSGAGDIIVSGAGSIFEGINFPIANVAVSNGAIARTSGTTGGIKILEFIGKLTGNADTATTAGKHGNLNVKEVDIGNWDMTALAALNVAHGLDVTKIKTVSVVVRDDTGQLKYSLPHFETTTGVMEGGFGINATFIACYIRSPGFFDDTAFDSTPYSRGTIVIDYVD